ncbi:MULTISPECIES: hypothetical protein [Morganellaceae]|uniref:Transcriptional regulator n=3 Tax=Morganellaceae TaxID=1903414 RepID=A0A1B8HBK3_9GAMM|nr:MULTISPECIES: hypothetical protein [Morganellaceae]ELR5072040.1 hypothetical protein [Providencia rettgeri]MDV5235700.1 hypothetical protein [Providencia rettgeri]OBU06445.1 hypothetical protein AYY17_20630 [Morganella psychrotolerans]UNH32543.1 hypothetical protein MNY72_16000 [Moellerella wisconsensis]UNH40861.1 hypothetical protein MNY70_16775 [Moellerella wisconsensis]
MSLPLGKLQHALLHDIVIQQAGKWWPGCQLTVQTLSRSRIILDALVVRKLLTHEGSCHYQVTSLGLKIFSQTGHEKVR